MDQISRGLVLRTLSGIRIGSLTVQDHGESWSFGADDDSRSGPVLRVHSPAFYRAVVRGGTLGAAQAWIDGHWDCSDLTSLFRMLLRNEQVLGRFRSFTSLMTRGVARLAHVLRANTRRGSRRNIHAHYDLGNQFFELFLDPTMMYSSGYFPHPQATMEEASMTKLEQVCEALELGPDDHVLEIGTGWGGFAMHAATTRGCRVTTTTISSEQFAFARERVRAAGLQDRVTVLQSDYRDLTGRYSRLVSIEMIEAVGRRYLPQFFQTCEQLLQPGGRMLVQAITIAEQRSARYARSTDFIQRYIFPGGYLPSISLLQECVRTGTSLQLQSLRDFGLHYAQTLRHWQQRFRDQIAQIAALGFGEHFIRMWLYYLHYCEAAFEERATGVIHAVWLRPETGR